MTGWAVAAAILLAFWVGLCLDRKRSWPGARTLAGGPRGRGRPSGRVTVLVPARNEAEVIGGTLPGLLAQAESFASLIVVDDRSTDGTGDVVAGIVERVAAEFPLEQKVRVITPEPTPRGWSGKLHALRSGLDASASGPEPSGGVTSTTEPSGGKGSDTEWILLTDADIRHPRASIDQLLAKAREGPYDLVSVMARLRAETFWERILIPPFVYFFQLLYPFRRVSDPCSRVAAAAGGCILLRAETLRAIGGLEAIRNATIDDVALARKVKDGGGRCWIGLHPEIASVRPYRGLSDIVEMVARSAFTQLRFRYSLLVATVIFLASFFVSPPLLVLSGFVAGDAFAAGAAALAWILQAATLLPAVRYHRVPAGFAATLPLASALYGAMTILSAWRHLRGRGSLWKGRAVG